MMAMRKENGRGSLGGALVVMLLGALGSVAGVQDAQAQEPGPLRIGAELLMVSMPPTQGDFSAEPGIGPGLRVNVEGLGLEGLRLGLAMPIDTRVRTRLDETLEYDWTRTALQAEVGWGVRLVNERVHLGARLGLGYVHHRLALEPASYSSRIYEGRAHGLIFSAQAVGDIALLETASKSWSLGMGFAWGLTGHTTANFEAMQPVYEEGDRVERAPFNAGRAASLGPGWEVVWRVTWRP
ncbi:hypothetical protein DL240_10240 [Lujinxingia litoralis]|uniref:Outer membrane protein beta-barrel domain-containing protein n=1 Tax=Lujinxingia litoralis TaxID=2211119 RepID=A0A328C9B3_9DELT|nr:hypothetical protein [Lujinxingia litoralis]RAL22223.1 hypothetical protein DL240_10240 [Lujinxingia litoralis]